MAGSAPAAARRRAGPCARSAAAAGLRRPTARAGTAPAPLPPAPTAPRSAAPLFRAAPRLRARHMRAVSRVWLSADLSTLMLVDLTGVWMPCSQCEGYAAGMSPLGLLESSRAHPVLAGTRRGRAQAACSTPAASPHAASASCRPHGSPLPCAAAGLSQYIPFLDSAWSCALS